MTLQDDEHGDQHRWDHAPLEEGLRDARALTVSTVDLVTRNGWEQLARHAGIPGRRWRRHYPIVGDRIIALVDGQPAFDAAAWERFVSLVPGAVALPSRTAVSFGISRSALRVPDRRSRLLDLLAARRRRRRIARAMRTLEADHARHSAGVALAVDAAIADGDDGAAFEQLPAYALAARFDQLVATASTWWVPQLVDLLAASTTTQLVQQLVERGRAPGDALLEAAALQSGGGAQVPEHLTALAGLEMTDGAERDRVLAQWRDSPGGWHAMRDLLLESPPLRTLGDGVRALVPTMATAHADPIEVPEDDPELVELVGRARSLTARRERLSRDRALQVAGLRAVAWTLADRLQHSGTLANAGDAFDLEVGDLLRLARGVEVDVPRRRTIDAGSAGHGQPTAEVHGMSRVELRGIPASAGVGNGRVLVVDDPAADLDVDGAVLVCLSTDPAWMPLLMRCSALVTERGGPLSHAAIVARELRLPTVVGVRGALEAAAGRDLATVDGAAGTVRFEPAR